MDDKGIIEHVGGHVVQFDHDEEMEPMHGMCGTLDSAFAVQRTIKRAELTGFLCVCAEEQLVLPQLVWKRKESSMALERRNAMHWPKAKDADLWIPIWEEVRRIHPEGTLQEG